ncbi:MAG: MFS transporter [Dehalococcoidia bacterium]|nr:MFS transporter [Dehalococcoidia bacterium]
MLSRLHRATQRSQWTLVIALGMGVFVGGFDQTFIVPVLSSVLRDFDVPLDDFGSASWTINGYLLGYVAALPLMGRVADVHGYGRVFVAALVLYMAASVAVALSPNLQFMAVARAATAVGGGALVPVALGVAAQSLGESQRPLGLSAISIADDGSSLLGPLWGTAVGVWLGWRGLFWLNVVLGLPVLVAVLLLARRMPAHPGGKVDWKGGLLLTSSLAALTFALADVAARPRPLEQTLGLYFLSAVLLVAFIRAERGTGQPLVELGMFRDRRVFAGFLVFLLEGGGLICALVNIPLMAEVLWDKSGAGPGLVLMRMVLFMIVGGVLGGLLVRPLGPRITATTGLLLSALGLLGMALWVEAPGDGVVWATLAVAGLGFTLSDAPVYLVVADATDSARRVSAMALLQVAQTLGMMIGLALLASQGLGRFDQRAADLFAADPAGLDPADVRDLIHQTLDETFIAAAVAVAIAAAVAAVLLPRHATSKAGPS